MIISRMHHITNTTRKRPTMPPQRGVFLAVATAIFLASCAASAAQSSRDANDESSEQGGAPASDKCNVILEEYSYTQIHMAMPVTVTVWAGSEQHAHRACLAAFSRVTTLERVLSDYDSASELSRFCRQAGTGPVAVSPDLFAVLALSKRVAHHTQGAFDPTMGAVVALWRSARKTHQLPHPEALQTALGCSGFEQLMLSEVNHTAHLLLPETRIDLGGVAKGFIGDQVVAALRQRGINRVRFEAGGDVVLGEAPPQQRGWRINLPHLGDKLLSNCGVSVSGDTQQFLEIEGKRYSHIIDPQSGLGITSRQMAIVIARSGALSDSLATAGTVMVPDEFQESLRAIGEVHGWTFRAAE